MAAKKYEYLVINHRLYKTALGVGRLLNVLLDKYYSYYDLLSDEAIEAKEEYVQAAKEIMSKSELVQERTLCFQLS